MKKLFLATLFLFGLCSQASALDSFFTFSSCGTALTANSYYAINACAAGNATEANQRLVIAWPVTISGLHIAVSAAPDNGGGTQSRVFTLVVNGTPSTLTCTITEAGTTCSDTTHSVNLVRGDYVTIQNTIVGTPTAGAYTGYALKTILGTNSLDPIGYPANSGTLSTSATNYFSFWSKGATATENTTQFAVPVAGTFKRMYVLLSGAPANGAGTQTYTFTVNKNGTPAALTCVVSEAQTSCQDMANAVAVSAGDLISVSSVPASTPTARGVTLGVVFEATRLNDVIFSTTSAAVVSAAVANYLAPNGAAAGVTTVNNSALFPGNFYVTGLWAHAFTAPANGAGTQTYTVALRDVTANAVSNASCVISEAETDCSYTTKTALAATDFAGDTKSQPASTPAASILSVGVAYTNKPTAGAVINSSTIKNSVIAGF